MIRVVLFFLILAALAYGGMLLVENPGHVTLTWHGEVVDAPAALLVIGVAVAAVVLWTLVRFVFGLPSLLRFTARQRRREKGYAALSRGLIAVGSGDGRTATRAASQAGRHLKNDPLAIMLRAQAAHMNGEAHTASAAFEELAHTEEGRVLGLRGLHAEAMRRGDESAARHFAAAAHRITPLPWSAQAVLEHRAADGDWEKALATVETNISAGLVDKATGERQRAVLETAIAQDKAMTAPEAALSLARSAIKRAPDLAPPVVTAVELLSRRGDIRKASRLVEKAWARVQHPEIAQAYLDIRAGDSTTDRLERAKKLVAIASYDPVGRMAVTRAALAAKDFSAARGAMAPLIAEGKRPSVRQCVLMAELEEAEHGDTGLWREWLARASRAPLDPAWVADGIVYESWAPASPSTGKLDAFHWQVPAERLGPAMDAMPIPERRREEALDAPRAVLTHRDDEPVAAPASDGDDDGTPEAVPEPIIGPTPSPRINAPPIVTAEARRPSGIRSLFHRRVIEETQNGSGNGHAMDADAADEDPDAVLGSGSPADAVPSDDAKPLRH